MINQKLYLIPTTPSYENEKDILRMSNREILPANASLSYKYQCLLNEAKTLYLSIILNINTNHYFKGHISLS